MTTESPAVYEWTGPTGVHFKQIREPSGVYYHHETPPRVIDVLEMARVNHTRIRIWSGDTKTGEAWPEEYDVVGTVGMSTGRIKIPLLIKTTRSMGGGAISDRSIVAIATRPNHFAYQHPTLNLGRWHIGDPVTEGYAAAVYRNDSLHAQFKKSASAPRYIAFMLGERFSK